MPVPSVRLLDEEVSDGLAMRDARYDDLHDAYEAVRETTSIHRFYLARVRQSLAPLPKNVSVGRILDNDQLNRIYQEARNSALIANAASRSKLPK